MSEDRTRRGRGRPRDEQRQPATIQALDRGLAVFALVAREGKCTLTELAATAGMAPSTLHRTLETLRVHGMVEFDAYRQAWSIGAEAFRIGQGYTRQASYLEAARILMRRLVAQTGESASVAALEGHELVYVSQIETQAPIRAFIPPGTRGFLQATGIGKALLACMPEQSCHELLRSRPVPAFTRHTITQIEQLLAELQSIRTHGWALDDEERYLGMRCIAAPIFNEFGEAIAGLSISGPTARLGMAEIKRYGPTVRAAADDVTARIGGHVPPGLQPNAGQATDAPASS